MKIEGNGMSIRRKGVIWLIVFPVVVIAALLIALHFEQEGGEQARGVPTQNVGQLKRVTYQGQTYREKPALTSLLLIGTDRPDGTVGYGARQGGQADFLMLVVIDDNEKVVHQLQIDRDTITAVETLGVLGNPVGTKDMQICLAHAFGATPEANCRSVQTAVEHLLEGIGIDYYLALGMDSIGMLNDALGGVTVTLTEDLTGADAQMAAGATLKLTGGQAELLVRGRMQLGDGTNEARMNRQRLYLKAAAGTLKERIRTEPEFLNGFLEKLEGAATMNIQRSQLLHEMNTAYAYEVRPIQTLEGTHKVGESGFMEFHAATEAAAQWVIDVFYEKEV